MNSLLHETNLFPIDIAGLTEQVRDVTVELLVNDSPSLFSMDPSSVNLLREVAKHKETFLEVSMQFDNVRKSVGYKKCHRVRGRNLHGGRTASCILCLRQEGIGNVCYSDVVLSGQSSKRIYSGY
jgi:hypothetical protein